MRSMYKYLVATDTFKEYLCKTQRKCKLNTWWGVKFCKCTLTAHCDTEAVFTGIPDYKEVSSIYFLKIKKKVLR